MSAFQVMYSHFTVSSSLCKVTYVDKLCAFRSAFQQRTLPYTPYTTFPDSRTYTSTCRYPLLYHCPGSQYNT